MSDYFASNLRKLRVNNNLTQEELADKLSYSSQNISKWEKGLSIPSLDVIKKLSIIFNNIDINKLLYENLIFNKYDIEKDLKYIKDNLFKFDKFDILLMYDLIEHMHSNSFVLKINNNNYNNLYISQMHGVFNDEVVNLILDGLVRLKSNLIVSDFSITGDDEDEIFIIAPFNYDKKILEKNIFSLEDLMKIVERIDKAKMLSYEEYSNMKQMLKIPTQTAIVLGIIEDFPHKNFSLEMIYNKSDVLVEKYKKSKSIKNTIRTSVYNLVRLGIVYKTDKKGCYMKHFYSEEYCLDKNEKLLKIYTKSLLKDLKTQIQIVDDEFNYKLKYIYQDNKLYVNGNKSNLNIYLDIYNINDFVSLFKDIDYTLTTLKNNGIINYFDCVLSDNYKELEKDYLVRFDKIANNEIIINYAMA